MVDKTFHLGLNGEVFEVKAANEAEAKALLKKNYETMPRVIARGLPDNGRVLERPNGQRYFVASGMSTTDPAKIAAILETSDPGKVSRDAIDEDVLRQAGPAAGIASQYLKGIPFAGKYVDEMMGDPTSMRALQGAMERQRPGQTMAANLTSGVVNSAAALAALPAGITSFIAGSGGRMLPQMLRGAAVTAPIAAVEGAVSGYGDGTTPEERAASAESGAVFGAGAGAVGGLLGPVVARGAENLIGYIARSDVAKIAANLGISKQAATVIKNTFEMGGDMTAAMDNLRRAGDEGMLADAGPAAQALLDGSAAAGGEASRVVRNEIGGRMTRTNDALTGSLDTQLGLPPLGPQTALREIAQRSAPAREAAYTSAYGKTVDWSSPSGQEVLSVLQRIDPASQSAAIARANAILRDEGRANEIIDAAGGVIGPRAPMTVMQLDALKRGLNEAAEAANAATGIPGKIAPEGRRVGNQAGDLRDALGRNVPEYDTAVRLGGDKIAEERAFMAGRNSLSTATEIEDVIMAIRPNASADEIAAAKSGLRSAFSRLMGDVRGLASNPLETDAGQVVAALKAASSDNAKAKVRAILGNDVADALYAEFDKAAQSAIVNAAVAVNSKTAMRTGQKQMIDEMTTPGILGTAMRGEPINTSRALIQAVTGQTDEFTAQQKQRIYADIATALTQKKGREAELALQFMQDAMSGQPLTEAQNRFLAEQISTALSLGGAAAAGDLSRSEQRIYGRQ
jgi:hypothetical protein